MKRGENFGEGEFQIQKTRAATPTKLGITQTIQNRNLAKNPMLPSNRRTQMTTKYDDLDEEELSRSGKSTPTRSNSRQKLSESHSQSPKNSNYELNRFNRAESPRSPRAREAPDFKPRNQRNESPTRSASPRDSLNVYDHNKENKEFGTAFDKHTKTLDNLLSKLFG